MTANDTATRAQAIAAAAARFDGSELPYWSDSEYMHGMCALIAATFGTNADEHGARSEVWDEIAAEHARIALREKAEKIAAEQMRIFNDKTGRTIAAIDGFSTARQIQDMVTAAAFAALTESADA